MLNSIEENCCAVREKKKKKGGERGWSDARCKTKRNGYRLHGTLDRAEHRAQSDSSLPCFEGFVPMWGKPNLPLQYIVSQSCRWAMKMRHDAEFIVHLHLNPSIFHWTWRGSRAPYATCGLRGWISDGDALPVKRVAGVKWSDRWRAREAHGRTPWRNATKGLCARNPIPSEAVLTERDRRALTYFPEDKSMVSSDELKSGCLANLVLRNYVEVSRGISWHLEQLQTIWVSGWISNNCSRQNWVLNAHRGFTRLSACWIV